MNQTLVVAMIVGLALAYVAQRAWKTMAAARAKKAGGGGCEDCH